MLQISLFLLVDLAQTCAVARLLEQRRPKNRVSELAGVTRTLSVEAHQRKVFFAKKDYEMY